MKNFKPIKYSFFFGYCIILHVKIVIDGENFYIIISFLVEVHLKKLTNNIKYI